MTVKSQNAFFLALLYVDELAANGIFVDLVLDLLWQAEKPTWWQCGSHVRIAVRNRHRARRIGSHLKSR